MPGWGEWAWGLRDEEREGRRGGVTEWVGLSMARAGAGSTTGHKWKLHRKRKKMTPRGKYFGQGSLLPEEKPSF